MICPTPEPRAVLPAIRAGRRELPARRAFTLVEMLVVVTIIAVLVGLVLPGAARMWAQRNEAGAINLVRGLLESVRSQARRSGERGLFFYVDPLDDVQRVAFIEGEPVNERDRAECIQAGKPEDCINQPMTTFRFRVVSDAVHTMPRPYRVMPAPSSNWPISPTATPAQWRRFGNDLFHVLDGRVPEAPYHRNFFTVIFGRDGTLQVDRQVLVHDPDADGDQRGDKTRLYVTGLLEASTYRAPDGSTRAISLGSGRLSHLLCYDDRTVANFPSVAGLVVYDDSVGADLDGSITGATRGEQAGQQIAQEVSDHGRPIYISRQTGDIISGEKGL